MSEGGFGQRLAEAVRRRRSALALGFDPFLDLLPPPLADKLSGRLAQEAPDDQALGRVADAVARWGEAFIDACGDLAVAVKFQMACFEQLQAPGWQALARLVGRAKQAGLMAIADGKRGDIGTSTHAYGCALFGPVPLPGGRWAPGLGVDAATVHPYLGEDTVEALSPWLEGQGRGLFVLVHTSNPSATQIQRLGLADGRWLADEVAEQVARWSRRWAKADAYGPVGAVVGATHRGALARLRPRLSGVWLLVPGVGVQGGEVEALRGAFDAGGLGAVVSVSRSVLGAWRRAEGRDWKDACRDAAAAFRETLERVRAGGG